MNYLPLAIAGLALAMSAPLAAGPRETAAAVADRSRSADNRALDEVRHPREILDFADVPRGAAVLDVMAGNGYYSELLADVVGPQGVVYASNPPNFHEADKWTGLLRAHRNVRTLLVPVQQMTFPPESLDVIFTHTVYHDLYWESERNAYPRVDVPALLANWYAALKPGGSIVVVDHAGAPGDVRDTAVKLHRIDPAQVKADMAALGMTLVAEGEMLRRNDDDYSVRVFDPKVAGKTDRFALKFVKK